MKKNRSTIIFIFILILAFITAIVIHLWVTENGEGINPDSVSYIVSANNILKGSGLFTQGVSSHFPPIYPIILTITGFFNSNIVDSVRWLHAILFATNAILFGATIYLGTHQNLIAVIFGVLIFFSSKAVLSTHSYALSESPFLMFSLIAFLLLAFFISSQKRIFLILSSISLGFALATRYVGIALLPPAVIVLFLFIKRPVKYKVKTIITMVILALTPVSIWIIRNLLIKNSATNRKFLFHPRSISSMGRAFVDVFHNFILPDSGSKYFKTFELILISVILIYMFFVLYKKQSVYNDSEWISFGMTSFGLLFSLSYISVVVFSIFFIDAAIPINNRIMMPVFLFLTISVISMVFLFSKIENKRQVWLMFLVCVLFSVRFNLFPMIDTANDFHTNGIEYNSRRWNESETISTLRSIDPDNEIYSNGWDVILLKTGYKASSIPNFYSSTSLVQNEKYNDQVSSMCNKVIQGEAILVYLKQINWRNYLPKKEQLLEACQLPVLYDTEDGTIYGLPEK